MQPKPIGNGYKCTYIEAGGVYNERGEFWNKIDEYKDK